MHISYSEQGDSLIIHFRQYVGNHSYSKFTYDNDGIETSVMDFDKYGDILGVEFKNAAEKFGKEEVIKYATSLDEVL